MLISIATWNVNSVKSRLLHLVDWLKSAKPDIVLLQELKCMEDVFPCMEIEELGYNLAIHGQKTYNGVAILSKFKLEEIKKGLPGNEDDEHARYIEAVVSINRDSELGIGDLGLPFPKAESRKPNPEVLRVASVYVPNGQTSDSEKFPYKLRFLDRLYAHFQTLRGYDEMLAVGGDYNIAPEDRDVHNPQEWEGSVLTHDEVRRRFRKLLYLGMYDAQRLCEVSGLRGRNSGNDPTPDPRHLAPTYYTWWDYRQNALERDDGLRIDHLLLSPQAADKITGCEVHKNIRALEKASDHAPVVGTFRF